MILLTTSSKEGTSGEKESIWQKVKKQKTRTFAFCISIILIALFFVAEFTTNIQNIDWGGFQSFLGFIAIILFFRIDDYVKTEYKKIKDIDNFTGFIILFFVIVGFFGLWFALRYFGLILKNSLIPLDSSFNYSPSEIFIMLGYVLTANLCFNLVKTFSDPDLVKKSGFKKTAPKLLETLIQAIMIGLITFIPRYADPLLLDSLSASNTGSNRIFGSIIYVLVLITLIIVLLLMIWFRKREFPKAK